MHYKEEQVLLVLLQIGADLIYALSRWSSVITKCYRLNTHLMKSGNCY